MLIISNIIDNVFVFSFYLFSGSSCGDITFSFSKSSKDLPGLEVNVVNPLYNSSALLISVSKPSSPDFYLINAVSNFEVFYFDCTFLKIKRLS